MVLSERQILRRLYVEEDLVIAPILNPRKQIGPTSVDLRLGTEFKVPRTSRHTHLEPSLPLAEMRTEVARLTDTVRIGPLEPFVLHPGEFALASTLEYVCLPSTLAARLEGRSTWGRLGLQVHSTAGFVDPGFEGVLTFELQNMGRLPLKLFSGIRVAQISFYECGLPSTIPYKRRAGAKYAEKIGSVSSLFFEDYEFEVVRQDSEASQSCDLGIFSELPQHTGIPASEIRRELAILLYQKGKLDIDMASRLAGVDATEFGALLAARRTSA